jgi:transposase
MDHYAGIDVSLEQSSVCVVDATGRIVREAKVASEPEALITFLRGLNLPLARIGLEAGPLSQWLQAALVKAGFEAVLLEMTVPGVGALVAVTFTSGVDAPERFARSKGVGAHFGLTPRKHQSGETDVTGAVSRVGDVMVRTALYEAAHILLTRAVRFSALKRWALEVAKRRGMKRAKVALARKLAVILHRMWVDGTTFRGGREAAAA